MGTIPLRLPVRVYKICLNLQKKSFHLSTRSLVLLVGIPHSNGFNGVINAFYQQKIVIFNVLGPLMLTNLSLNSDIGVEAIGPETNFTTTKKT